MTAAPAVELAHHTRLASVRETLIGLYTDVRAPLLHLPNYAPGVFAERVGRHAGEAGFEVVIGYDGDRPVGYAYGDRVERGDRWWERMRPPLGEELTAEPVIVIKEIGVRAPWRGTGVVRRIHDALVADRPETRSGPTVNPQAGEGKVLRLYEGWGYRAVGAQRPSPESPVLTAMLRPNA